MSSCQNKEGSWDFAGGPVAKTALPMQRTLVRFLVRKLEPACPNYEFSCCNKDPAQPNK